MFCRSVFLPLCSLLFLAPMSTKRRTSLILESHETDEYDSEIKHIVMKFFGTFSQFDHTFFFFKSDHTCKLC